MPSFLRVHAVLIVWETSVRAGGGACRMTGRCEEELARCFRTLVGQLLYPLPAFLREVNNIT